MKTLLSLALSALIAGAAQAQTDYPNRPPRFIVPFPPGGSVDIVTRIVAAKWGDLLGQPVVVENRAGAGGNVGADYAARAAPDGYTILSCGIASHGVSPALYNKLPYDHLRDFAPISLMGKTPNCLVVHPSVPAQSLKEFVALVEGESRQVQLRLAWIRHLAADDDGALQAHCRDRSIPRPLQGRRPRARGRDGRAGDGDVRQPARAARRHQERKVARARRQFVSAQRAD